MNRKIDLIIIGKYETIDYSGYSDLPLDRVELFQKLVQLRMIYLHNGFRSFLEVFNYAKFGRYYSESNYNERRKMLNIWNLPSLNPALAATPLLNEGFNCKIINNLDSEMDYLIEFSKEMRHPLIAISTTFMLSWSVVGRLITKIKKVVKNATFILGGAFVNDQSIIKGIPSLERPMRKYGISYALYSYNSEKDFCDLVKNLRSNNLSLVNNLVYFDENNVFKSTKEVWNSPFILKENAPPWDKIDLPENNHTIQLRSSSGCAFKCSFCTYPVSTKGFHPADFDYLSEQLNTIKKLNITNLVFIDDTPNVPPNRFLAMLNILKSYNFRWYSFLRVQYIDEEIAQLMKESGCDGVYLGIESSNDQILKNMNKAATRKQFLKGIEVLKKYNITTFAAFIIGFPGETEDTIRDNINFIKESGVDYYSLKEFWYAPNAPISKDATKFGLTGFGNEWSHNTMDSTQASIIKMNIFNEITNSTYLDSDSGLWYLVYLRDQGFDWPTIKKAQAIINEMLRRDNNKKFLDKDDLIWELKKLLGEESEQRTSFL